jgi:hypothetical protein
MCHVEQEERIRLLLGGSNSNYNVHHEPNTHYCNSSHNTWGEIHMEETNFFKS